MAGPLLNIRVQGLPEVEARIAALNTAINPTLIADEAGALIFNRIRTRFLQQVDSSNQPWKPSLAALTRAKTGRGGGTLYDTGNLFRSLQLFAAGPNAREIGSNVPYGPYHNFGTGRTPQREFLGIGRDDINLAEQLVMMRILKALT
jgi:phage gpG-like protein